MIGFLSGKIHSKSQDTVILLIEGVGYQIFTPPSTLLKLEIGQPLEVYIHTHVREENLDLFGFKTSDELALFKILLSVSGIGTKTALNIIDRGIKPVKNAVINADVDFFQGIPRLGRKNAQRIIIELKNKIGGTTELDLSAENIDHQQIIEALSGMGYSKAEATKSIRQLPVEAITIEDKIRFALKTLGK